MSALADKLRRARESEVEAGGHVFTIRRPTDVEAHGMAGQDTLDAVCRFVVGWNLSEIDLGVPGGSGVAAGFDVDALREWLSDRVEVLGKLAEAIVKAYQDHVAQKADAEKN